MSTNMRDEDIYSVYTSPNITGNSKDPVTKARALEDGQFPFNSLQCVDSIYFIKMLSGADKTLQNNLT